MEIKGALSDEIVLGGKTVLGAASDGTIFEASLIDGAWRAEIKHEGSNFVSLVHSDKGDYAYIIEFSTLSWLYVCSVDVLVEEYDE